MSGTELTLAILAVVVPSVISALALYYARKSALLVERQAEARPLLRVTEARLLDPAELDELRALDESRLLTGLRGLGEMNLSQVPATLLRAWGAARSDLPEKTLLVTLVNEGQTAAYALTGWIYLEAERLLPLKWVGGSEVSLEDGFYKIELTVGDRGLLWPGRSCGVLVLVAVRNSGSARIRYDFAFADGRGPSGVAEVPTV